MLFIHLILVSCILKIIYIMKVTMSTSSSTQSYLLYMLKWGKDLVLCASKFVTLVIKWMKAARNMHCDEMFTFTC